MHGDGHVRFLGGWGTATFPSYPTRASSGSRRCCAKLRRVPTEDDARAPREGAALLQGIVWCGHCGRKMAVKYRGRNGYLCNHLNHLQGDPVCQQLPADPIDARVVAAFFAAVTPAELEAWRRAHDARRQADEALDRAEAQQVERLRYQALLAERQFNKVDPDNRNGCRRVGASLGTGAARAAPGRGGCWPGTGRARAAPETLSTEDRERFLALGPQLPALWQQPDMTRERRKVLLRSLIDKVVLRRAGRRPDQRSHRLARRRNLRPRGRARGEYAAVPDPRRRDGGPAA